jgi:uncharacterized DUF497 family protein
VRFQLPTKRRGAPGIEPGSLYGASNKDRQNCPQKYKRSPISICSGGGGEVTFCRRFCHKSATNFGAVSSRGTLHSSHSTYLALADERQIAVYTVHGMRCERCSRVTQKAEANRRKHGVQFLVAVIVFDDDPGITLLDEKPTEERYVTFGMDTQGRVLAVSCALRYGLLQHLNGLVSAAARL